MSVFYQDEYVTIIHDDCRHALDTYDFGHVHCCVTSPPYFGLRDYKHADQIGLENTPQEYVIKMVNVFGQISSVLRSDSTFWLNLGDSFKDKNLVGIPWRTAFALKDARWYLRSDIIWAKGNPMPSSVTDRPTTAHEYIFLLTKSARYYYDADAIAESALTAGQVVSLGEQSFAERQADDAGVEPTGNGTADTYTVKPTRNKRTIWNVNSAPFKGAHFATFPPKLIEPCILAGVPQTICSRCGSPWVRIIERTANNDGYKNGPGGTKARDPRGNGASEKSTLATVARYSVTTLGFKPTCTCNAETEPGTVIDPFGGAGTTGVVAKQHGRRAILIEQNESYCQMAADRIAKVTPQPKEQAVIE